MEFLEVIRTTPSVREFRPDAIPDDVLRGILDAARFAPNGGNRQNWRVIILRDRVTRERIRDLYVIGWREYFAHVRQGLVPFAPRDEGRWTGPAVDLEDARATPAPNDFADQLDTAPALLVVLADLGGLAVTDNGLDRQSIVGGGSIYPFCHNILLAARNVGVGGVMTTILARQEPAVKDLLDVPVGYAMAALIALGYPVRQVTKLRRATVEEFTTIDRFDGQVFL